MTHGGVPLKRTLSAMSLMALGIGNIISAGIFVLTGQAAAAHAGPAIGLSFVVSAIACGFAGMCYAEMASSVPISGSAYTYAYATMGEIIAWIIGWGLLLEYALGAATVAIGWSGYVVSFLKDFGITVPDIWSAAPFDFDPARGEWRMPSENLEKGSGGVEAQAKPGRRDCPQQRPFRTRQVGSLRPAQSDGVGPTEHVPGLCRGSIHVTQLTCWGARIRTWE
jgi:hypothetical protein